MQYFRNDHEASHVDGINIENSIGKVIIHGTIDISPNKRSLLALSNLIDKLTELKLSVNTSLESGEEFEKQEKLQIPATDEVENPF